MRNEKVNLVPKLITCSKCGQGEGTLQKNGLGGYRHVKCPPKRQLPMIITDGRVK
jgi:hypothetical protein